MHFPKALFFLTYIYYILNSPWPNLNIICPSLVQLPSNIRKYRVSGQCFVQKGTRWKTYLIQSDLFEVGRWRVTAAITGGSVAMWKMILVTKGKKKYRCFFIVRQMKLRIEFHVRESSKKIFFRCKFMLYL